MQLFLLLLPNLLDDLINSRIDERFETTAEASVRLDYVPEVIKVDIVEGGIVAKAIAASALGPNPTKVVGKEGAR